MGAFWLHSLAVAACASMLGLKLGVSRDDVANYFAAGLLHDIGKVVFALYMPDEFEAAVRMAAEPEKILHHWRAGDHRGHPRGHRRAAWPRSGTCQAS